MNQTWLCAMTAAASSDTCRASRVPMALTQTWNLPQATLSVPVPPASWSLLCILVT